jgi:protoporphyrinogen oxidase
MSIQSKRYGRSAEVSPVEDVESQSLGYAILGGGPAGLTGALALGAHGHKAVVFEAEGQVGGIAKTVEVDGYRFDLGGHRFFTKVGQIERLWADVLGDEFLTRPRLSRIYFAGKFFSYPLTSKDVVARLGLWESTLCVFSYLWAQRHRGRTAETFEEWVTARFGRRLYDAFFRSYTEKIWGIPGSEIRSLWAAQRIKNFSLWKAALTIVGLRRDHVTTLIEEFKYPRLGPGQMWERLQERLELRHDIAVELNHRVTKIHHRNMRVETIEVESDGRAETHAVDGVLSSLALQDLIAALKPAPPQPVLDAAAKLRYRDFCLVALMSTQEQPFPDNWIYIHDPGTRAGRVQNFGAWSEDMVMPGTTCLGVEYFCFQGDDIWEMSEADAVAMATREMAEIGLIDPAKVTGGAKVLVPKAYPTYDREYEAAVEEIRSYLDGFENLQPCGRNGLHRYNNQDHSMLTAIFGASNLIGKGHHDVWSVNADDVYLEEGEIDELVDLELVV